MADSTERVLKLVRSLAKIRGNPILILDLKQIEPRSCLSLQKKLFGRKFSKLDVILQTPGGDIDAAYNTIKLLRLSAQRVNVIVPLYAKSAGTLICLGGDSILMTSLSELGPLDTQIREEQEGTPLYISALNGFKALEQVQLHTLETLDIATKLIIQRSGGMKISEAVTLATKFAGSTSGTLYQQLDPKKIGEYARALEIGERYGIVILTRYMGWNPVKAEAVVKKLVKSYPSHDFIIDALELKDLDLPASIVPEKEENILDELRLPLLESKGNIIEILDIPKKGRDKNESAENKK